MKEYCVILFYTEAVPIMKSRGKNMHPIVCVEDPHEVVRSAVTEMLKGKMKQLKEISPTASENLIQRTGGHVGSLMTELMYSITSGADIMPPHGFTRPPHPVGVWIGQAIRPQLDVLRLTQLQGQYLIQGTNRFLGKHLS